MTRVLHISDTYFGTVPETVERALQELVQACQLDLVLLGAGISPSVRRGQFAAARRFVLSLQRPVLAVPGNHDILLFNLAARLFNPYGNYRQAPGGNLDPVFEDGRVLAIGVNSTPAHRGAKTAR